MKERHFSLTSNSRPMREMRRKTNGHSIICHPIIPKYHVVDAPLEPDRGLLCRSNDFLEAPDGRTAFDFWHADNFSDEAGVEQEGLPACHRMDADERVLGFTGVAAYLVVQSAGTGSMHVSGMQRRQRLETFLHRRVQSA
jgi:hypothetical protein